METVKVVELFPMWDIGAPCPTIFADEHELHLAYYTPDIDVAVISFSHCFEHRMGMPDENLVERHPLGSKGLTEYEAHIVENSRWIQELEERYRVISAFSRAEEREYRHYVFTFHDRCFECVSSGYSVRTVKNSSIMNAFKEIWDQL